MSRQPRSQTRVVDLMQSLAHSFDAVGARRSPASIVPFKRRETPRLPSVATKAARLAARNPKLAAVIERLVDDMLDELEGA